MGYLSSMGGKIFIGSRGNTVLVIGRVFLIEPLHGLRVKF